MRAPLLVHIVEHTLPEISGYSVRTHHILRALQRRGRNVLALAPRSGVEPDEESRLDDIPYLHLSTGADTRTLSGHLYGLRQFWRRATEAIRGRGAALVHAHSPARIGFAGMRAARAAGVPFVYEWRGVWEDAAVDRGKYGESSMAYRLTYGLESYVLRCSDAVVCISRGLSEEAVRRGVAPERLTQVVNGVDVERFRPRPPDAALIERFGLAGCFVVGYLGNLYRYEGVDLLLRAFAELHAQVPRARLLLVGEGDLQSELRDWVESHGLQRQVIFAGLASHASVADYYSVCDVLAYPRRRTRSTELVTPLKPLEPMAMGLPVIASRVGGVLELVGSDGAAWLCEPNDVESLTTSLLRLTQDGDLRRALAERGQSHAQARRWEDVVSAYERPYAALLSAKS